MNINKRGNNKVYHFYFITVDKGASTRKVNVDPNEFQHAMTFDTQYLNFFYILNKKRVKLLLRLMFK